MLQSIISFIHCIAIDPSESFIQRPRWLAPCDHIQELYVHSKVKHRQQWSTFKVCCRASLTEEGHEAVAEVSGARKLLATAVSSWRLKNLDLICLHKLYKSARSFSSPYVEADQLQYCWGAPLLPLPCYWYARVAACIKDFVSVASDW